MREENYMAEGWFSVYRSIQDHWLWEDKPFSMGQAWIDLLLLANYEDNKAPYKDKIITFKKGTVNISIKEMSSRWGWSRKKTRRFLNLLENDEMVSLKVTTKGTTVTIANYVFYQGEGKTKGTTKEQPGYQLGYQLRNTTNNNNNINKKNKGDFNRTYDFEELRRDL